MAAAANLLIATVGFWLVCCIVISVLGRRVDHLYAAAALYVGAGAPPFGTFLSELLIHIKAIDMHYYATAGLLIVGLALAFIVVCMHIGRVVLGAANVNTQYFKAVLTSAVPALLLACSLLLGLVSAPALWSGLK
jgi:hypothetical protein